MWPCATTACPNCSIRHDRRYRYPFINCTNCGPRFTITVRLPYDRPNTTMRGFELCAACADEYHDPSGPALPRPAGGLRRVRSQVRFLDGSIGNFAGRPSMAPVISETDAAIAATQAALAAGQVVAVKGLGGYHLVCDATSCYCGGEVTAPKGSGRQAVCRDGGRRETLLTTWPMISRLNRLC